MSRETNVTHVVVIKPHYPGRLNISAAEITYGSESPEDTEVRRGYSSEGEVYVMGRREYDRRMSSHLVSFVEEIEFQINIIFFYSLTGLYSLPCVPPLSLSHTFSIRNQPENIVIFRLNPNVCKKNIKFFIV